MIALNGVAKWLCAGVRFDIYHGYHQSGANREARVAGTGIAKLFKHGRSQAVRLPKEFRLPGEAVRVRRIGRSVLLEPMERDAGDIRAVFAEIDRLGGGDFLTEGRPEQPSMPSDDVLFDP
jgi:antitoxin VapB